MLQETAELDIANRAADFDQYHFCAGFFRHQPDPAFDLVCDVWDHLNRPAQEIAAAFLADDLGVNLSAGEVADAVKRMSINLS